MTQLTDVAQGTTDSSRVGDQITLEALRVSFTLKEHPSSGSLTLSRVMVVQAVAMSAAWGTGTFQSTVLSSLDTI